MNRGKLTTLFGSEKHATFFKFIFLILSGYFSTLFEGRRLGLLDLLEDRFSGFGGVGGAGDGAADHQHGGSGCDGLGGGGDASLIFRSAACWADSRDVGLLPVFGPVCGRRRALPPAQC